MNHKKYLLCVSLEDHMQLSLLKMVKLLLYFRINLVNTMWFIQFWINGSMTRSKILSIIHECTCIELFYNINAMAYGMEHILII